MNWKCEFAEMAGYDCMTDAWKIIGPAGQRIYIDCGSYGQKSCDHESEEAGVAIRKAGDFAEFVTKALNAYQS